MNIYAHCSYIGDTGYNHHSRDFFRELSKLTKVKIRNFTVGKTWNGYNNQPHNNESYLNDIDKGILHEQILWNKDRSRSNFPIYNYDENFKQDLNIVLCETNHYIFYDNYQGPKIAYNVWESTLQPPEFFNKLLEYDELWVPSKWQKECTIKQGYPEDKIKVVPEGVDVGIFYPENIKHKMTSDGRFKFFLAGRWDYRKSTKEIIETFLKTFKEEEEVDMIISVDNPFSNDELKSTEERLRHYSLEDERIKILHFPPREDYINILKSTNVFLSCARSEGWNLPLIEAMACGVPSIYSNCSGQLEFAEGKGLPVNILYEKPVSDSTYNHFNESIGNYYEPDFNHLSQVMREVYENYKKYKDSAIIDSEIIRNNFNWSKVAKDALSTIDEFMLSDRKPVNRDNKIYVNFIEGAKVEILGDEEREYEVEFFENDKIMYSTTLKNNMWAKPSMRYYKEWDIKINGQDYVKYDPKDKVILISLDSKSFGDTIAWAPYAVKFAKERECKVILSTFHNEWFEGLEEYKDIRFVKPGSKVSCYASYNIGWYKNNEGRWDDKEKIPVLPNTIPLQQTACEILGLKYEELNYGLKFKDLGKFIKGKYVVIGTQSTAGCKEWEYDKWVELSGKLNKMGYKVVTSTKDKFFMKNTINDATTSFDRICTLLKHSEFFIGLSSGLSWINWSLGKKTIMIAGFTQDGHEFTENNYRVKPKNDCIKCWNDSEFVFDAGDWDWCPVYKGTNKQHICQKSITVDSVIDKVNQIINES